MNINLKQPKKYSYMKFLMPLFILVMMSSCAVNSRGGYNKLPPSGTRFSREMYWKKERSHGNIQTKKNNLIVYHKIVPSYSAN